MITSPRRATDGRPPGGPDLPTFRTPVRGHAYAPRPPGTGTPTPGDAARLVPEPQNPADPEAVAVWVEQGAGRWRIGYLDRGVAARIAPRLRAGLTVRARVDGWIREPEGRWERPVVVLLPESAADRQASLEAGGRPRGAGEAGPVRDARQGGAGEAGPAREARPDTAPGIWGRPPGVARRVVPAGDQARAG